MRGVIALVLAAAIQSAPAEGAWVGTSPRAKSVEAIARDPKNPLRLWAATMGAGVYRSLDGGVTWTGSRTGLTNTYVRCVLVNPSYTDSVFCGTNDGVFLSVDGGVTWSTRLVTSRSVRSLSMDPIRRSTLYAATYGLGIYKSLNGGASWTSINLGLVNTNVRDVAINPVRPDTLFAATATGGGIHFSGNGGLTWTQVADTTASGGAIEQIQFDPLNVDRIYAATLDRGVIRSTDGGVNWVRINRGLTSFRCRSLCVVDTMRYVGTDSAGVFVTTFSDTFWTKADMGLSSLHVGGLMSAPGSSWTVWAGTDGGGIFRTQNRGGTWSQLDGGLLQTFGFSLAVRPSTHKVYLGAGFGDQFWGSADEGVSWTRAVALFSVDSEHGVVPDPVAGGTVYLTAYGKGVYRSEDDGLSWFNPDSLTQSLRNPFVRPIVAWPGQVGHLFVGTGGGVYESLNGGATWTPDTLGMPPSFGVHSLALVPGSPATLYAGSDSSGVYRSSNGGASWAPVNTGLTSLFVHALLVDAASTLTVYAATDSGVFKSTTGGGGWLPARSGLPAGQVRALAQDTAHPQVIFCAVWGGGVFESVDGAGSWYPVFNLAGLPTLNVRSLAVDGTAMKLYAGTDDGVSVASNYDLTIASVSPSPATPSVPLAARPNPSRPGEVAFTYSLPRPGIASVSLYDARGRLVSVLAGPHFEAAGLHRVPWNGNDDTGVHVAAGVYFVQLRGPDGAQSARFVVLRQ